MQLGPQFLTEQLTDDQWTQFANIAWSIWRCRNDKTYGGKEPSIDRFQKYLSQITAETNISVTKRYLSWKSETIHDPMLQWDKVICMTDGSWEGNWQAGIGIVLLNEESMVL